jgi:hypothetical protein
MSQEPRQAGIDAYAAGQPFVAPTYRSEMERARWRLGWKFAAARAGDRDTFDRARMMDEHR